MTSRNNALTHLVYAAAWALVCSSLFAAGASAHAAAPPAIDGQVVVPWGDWTAAALHGVTGLVVAAAGWALRRAPAELHFMMRMARVDQLLERSIQFGVNSVAGAVAGRRLTVPVANRVLERAGDYAIAHAPELVARLGGLNVLKEKLLARLDVEEAAEFAGALRAGAVDAAPATRLQAQEKA
jgi:hypothetical protein